MTQQSANNFAPITYVILLIMGLTASYAQPVVRLGAEQTVLFSIIVAFAAFSFFWASFLFLRLYPEIVRKYFLLFIMFFFAANSLLSLIFGVYDLGVGISESERPVLIAFFPSGMAASIAAYAHYRRLGYGG